MKLQGTYTALITPFNTDLSVDYKGLERLVEFQIKNNISGLVPLGTTGETPTLTKEEQEKIVASVISTVNKRVPVIVGTGSNSTATTISNTIKAKEWGADAALVVAPYYNKPTQSGLFLHYQAIAEAVDLPVIVYNIKGRSGVNIETATLKKIAALPNVIGVKEASGDINQMGDVINQIKNLNPDFAVLSGDDAMTYPLMALGGDGLVSVASNLIPKETSQLVELCLAGNMIKARELHFKYLELFKTIFIETNPAPIKVAMEAIGLPAGSVRLPLAPLSKANRDILLDCVKAYQLQG